MKITVYLGSHEGSDPFSERSCKGTWYVDC